MAAADHRRAERPAVRISVARYLLGAVVVVSVKGAIDRRTEPVLDGLLAEVLARGALARLVVDLTGVDFFGAAAGVRCLQRAQRRAAAIGVPMVVVPGRARVAMVLRTCAAGQFSLAPSVDAACRRPTSSIARAGRAAQHADHTKADQLADTSADTSADTTVRGDGYRRTG